MTRQRLANQHLTRPDFKSAVDVVAAQGAVQAQDYAGAKWALAQRMVGDVTDAQLIAGKYGAFFGSVLYSKWYDLEPALHDLDIDIKDLQKVFGRDGSTCQEPIPAQPPYPPPFP